MMCDKKTLFKVICPLIISNLNRRADWMVYLIVVLVLAMVIGPVVWMRPSPGQARQAQMRAKARAMGLEIRVTELPQTHRAKVRREDTQQGVIYRLPVYGENVLMAVSHRSMRDTDNATWEESGDVLPSALHDFLEQVKTLLPIDVVAVELGPNGPGIFWRERGGEEALTQIAAQLSALRDAMKLAAP
jgi:hypothetical protein